MSEQSAVSALQAVIAALEPLPESERERVIECARVFCKAAEPKRGRPRGSRNKKEGTDAQGRLGE